MSVFKKFMSAMSLQGEDDRDLELDEGYDLEAEDDVRDDFEPEEEDVRPERRQRSSKKSFFSKNVQDEPSAPNVVALNSMDYKKLYVMVPKQIREARDAVNYIKQGGSVVLNLDGSAVEFAQHIIDFCGGACYALGGNFRRISKSIFILTPKAMTLAGDFETGSEDAEDEEPMTDERYLSESTHNLR